MGTSVAGQLLVFKPRPAPESRTLATVNDISFNIKFQSHQARRAINQARTIRQSGDELLQQAILLVEALRHAWLEQDRSITAECIQVLPDRLWKLRALGAAERSLWDTETTAAISEIEDGCLEIIRLSDPRGSRPAA